jgi:hypothetical protein
MNDYFLPSNYISKNGNPNITTFDPNDWISVYPVNRAFTFNDGKARMEITDLPINQNGTMVMQLFENSVMKLEGTKDNVTLRAGVNSESLSLKVVPATKPDKPDVKPDTPDVKPDKPDVKPDTPVTPVTPVTPTTPETAELVLTLEIQ